MAAPRPGVRNRLIDVEPVGLAGCRWEEFARGEEEAKSAVSMYSASVYRSQTLQLISAALAAA